MSTGEREVKTVEETGSEVAHESPGDVNQVRRSIAVPPKAREELKALLRTQNEAQERVRLVLGTLEEALDVPPGWVIRDIDEGFVGLQTPQT